MEDETLDELQDSPELANEDSVEETVEEETFEEEATDEVEDNTELTTLKNKNKQLFNRAKKAEEALKAAKPEKPQPKKINKASNDLLGVKEMAKFYAQGGSDEELEKVQTIMSAGKTFEEAVKDEMFVAYKKSEENKTRRKEAQIRKTSNASMQGGKSVSEMSDAEHRDFFNKVVFS